MTSCNDPNHSSPSAVTAHQDMVTARRQLEWEMAQKLFSLASHLILRLRVDPSSCRSPAQISSLLELASRFARLACDAPQPAPASPPDSGSLPSEIETALDRVYGPAPHSVPSPAEPSNFNSSSTEELLNNPDQPSTVL